MKQLIFLLALFTALSTSAQDFKGLYGVGLAVGEPSGFSIKKFNSATHAFQYTLGYSTTGNSGINLGVDFLLHDYEFISANKGSIPLYYGLGAHVKSYENESQIYVRVPLGVSYQFKDFPADVFFEFSPGIAIIPSPNLVVNFGVGGRFYFDIKRAVKKLEGTI